MSDKPLPTPSPMAPFRVIDAWLKDRGWERDRGAWVSRTKGGVTIASHEEAQRIQRRRDRRETAGAETRQRVKETTDVR